MLGVIGGSGLYKLDGLSVEKEHEIETPFGRSSDAIIEGFIRGSAFYSCPGMDGITNSCRTRSITAPISSP